MASPARCPFMDANVVKLQKNSQGENHHPLRLEGQ
jgi:hypothetical protein